MVGLGTRLSHAWTRRRSQGTTFAPSVRGGPSTSDQQTATSSGEHHGLAVDSRARETVERPGEQTAGVTPPSNVNPIPTNAAVEKLTEQVAALTEQVAALSAVQQRRQDGFNARPRPVRCYQLRESWSHS